jgi:hypothetical protein
MLSDLTDMYAINEYGKVGLIKCKKEIRGEIRWVGVTENDKGEEMLWVADNVTLVDVKDFPLASIHNTHMPV